MNMNNDFIYDPDYKASVEDFLRASSIIPEVKALIKTEQDKYLKLAHMIKYGEQLTLMQSYIYDLTMDECVAFADWISSFFELKKYFEAESPEIPKVSLPKPNLEGF